MMTLVAGVLGAAKQPIDAVSSVKSDNDLFIEPS
jgi:hypothetical protein